MVTDDSTAQPTTVAGRRESFGDRISGAVLTLLTVIIVVGTMLITGYQVWRSEVQLGDGTVLTRVALTGIIALLPPVLTNWLARNWTGSSGDWAGALLLVVVAVVFFLMTRQRFINDGLDSLWLGPAALTYVASLGPQMVIVLARSAPGPARPTKG